MSLLTDVLHAIQSADGPLSVADIARAVEADPAAVAGMLDLLARKGRLRLDDGQTCSATACGGCAVAGPEGCPLVLKSPTRFELRPKETASGQGVVPLNAVIAEE